MTGKCAKLPGMSKHTVQAVIILVVFAAAVFVGTHALIGELSEIRGEIQAMTADLKEMTENLKDANAQIRSHRHEQQGHQHGG